MRRSIPAVLVVMFGAACISGSIDGGTPLGPAPRPPSSDPPSTPAPPALGPEGFSLATGTQVPPIWTADSTSVRQITDGGLEITATGVMGAESIVVVLRIVEPAHGGTVSLSEDGNGSEFTLTLPDRGWYWKWSSRFTFGSGSVTITHLSDTQIAGAFNVALESMSGSAERLVYPFGRFNLRY